MRRRRRGLMEHPGRRVAVAEAALSRFIRFCARGDRGADSSACDQQAGRSQQSQEQLQSALENCRRAGGFSWFGGRSRRLAARLRRPPGRLRPPVPGRGHPGRGAQQFFGFLRGRLADRLRDLTFCRQRLRHMQEALAQSAGDTGRWASRVPLETGRECSALTVGRLQPDADAVDRLVLGVDPRVGHDPRRAARGREDLEQAARHFLETLTAEQWIQLDQAFQDQVLSMRGGLHKACWPARATWCATWPRRCSTRRSAP